jgi:hypothetical protein
LTSTSQLVKNSTGTHFTTYQTSLLKLLKIVKDVLFTPTIYTRYLGRIITNLNPLKDRNHSGPNSREVKFDF